jgi:DNA-binding response OmpR family regulator
VKVIFISGYTADVMHSKGILEHDVDLLTKPFMKGDLLQRVKAALCRKGKRKNPD